MAVISITRLHVRSWRFLPDLVLHSARITRQTRVAPGNLGMETLRESGMTFWIKSAWRDEASLSAFRNASAWKALMQQLERLCDEAATLQWEQETPRMPFWEDIGRRMQREGQLIPVKHPSEAQGAGRIPPMKG